jgi:imidazolonepropionase-like amidohydrolase
MDPMRAIQAATSVAAELLRMAHEIGAVKKGYVADLVGVPGNPLERIELLRDVQFVMKAGTVVKAPSSVLQDRPTTIAVG